MNEQNQDLIYDLQYLEASLGKIIALLAKYSILNLSVSLHFIMKILVQFQFSIKQQSFQFDIRDVKKMQEFKEKLSSKVKSKDGYVALCGHSLACEFYLLHPLILKVLQKFNNSQFENEYLQFLLELDDYVLLCGQYINQSFLVDEIIYK